MSIPMTQTGSDSAARARQLRSLKAGDTAFYWATRLAAYAVLLLLGGIIMSRTF